MAEARLSFFGLFVEDMAKSLAFYRRLGLDLPPEADRQPHVALTLPGGLLLVWDTIDNIRSYDPGWQKPSGGAQVALAFQMPSPAAVDSAYEELVGAGYEGYRAPWDAFWRQRYAVVHDPDGNAVDLFAFLENSGQQQ